ncbi:MAG TPA: hydroxyethylthiazole kinase [Desulfomonilia bacterium]
MPKCNVTDVWGSVESIRKLSPVIHNITNYVVMNSTANALLAIGASPVMAHALEEMDEMVGIAAALVVNIGTLSREWIKAMFKAAERATLRNIPVILDPVGAGATSFRTETAREFIRVFRPSVIRGNASEIMSVYEDAGTTKGVDSTKASHDAVSTGMSINEDYGSVVCISGETDYVIDAGRIIKIRNGHKMMTRVTGLGCTATALCGAFAAVSENRAQAAAHAMAVMGIAGEIAAERAAGPGTLQVGFYDALFNLSIDDIGQRLKVEN